MLSQSKIRHYRDLIRTQYDYNKELGKKLKKSRKKAGFSQTDVSEILNVDERTIKRKENGESTISLEDVRNFCILYECRLEDILPNAFLPYGNFKTSFLSQLPEEFLIELINEFTKEQTRRVKEL